MKKILITDKVHQSCIDFFKNKDFEVTFNTSLSPEKIKDEIKDHHALIVRSATKVTPDIIESADNLEIIGRAGSGVDNIDIEAATRKGILVMNTPGGNTISAAEHTMSMMLSLCRHIPQADKSMKEGKWEKKLFSGTELLNKKLGIAGLGKIGREVAARAQSFGMDVIAFDPIVTPESAEAINVKLVSLDELFAEADIITLHVPFNKETEDLISAGSIKKLKKGVKIVNCSRGGVVNEKDLIKGINDGIISGAALDVFEQEPPANKELVAHPKIICTPHLAASTEEAQEKVSLQIAEQIYNYFQDGKTFGLVNGLAVKYLNDTKLFPFVKLAEKIGLLHGQTVKDKFDSVELQFFGDQLKDNGEVLSTSFLKGFLSTYSDYNVNLVNAKLLAKEKGIVIEENYRSHHPNYSSLIRVVLKGKNNTHSISGIVIGYDAYRIIELNDYKMEFNPSGNILVYYNIDRPGVLARAGSLLADEGINIAGVSLSRIDKGAAALTIMNIDEEINKELLEKLREINGIDKVYFVQL